ncbi:hypothetical protein C0J52_13301 [Blattella germanica]|nr:hypothetical protein C0J52_13301 [Blattella germanica]
MSTVGLSGMRRHYFKKGCTRFGPNIQDPDNTGDNLILTSIKPHHTGEGHLQLHLRIKRSASTVAVTCIQHMCTVFNPKVVMIKPANLISYGHM